MKPLFLTFLCHCFCVGAATAQLAFQGFESTVSDTWSYTANPTGTACDSQDAWKIATSVGEIVGQISPATGSSFWAVLDLNSNCNGDAATFGTLTFATQDLSSVGDAVISFAYNVFSFDNGDDLQYQLILDGVTQTAVTVVNGASSYSSHIWDTVRIAVAASVNSVGLIIGIKQNGDEDWGGIDDVQLTACTTAANPTNAAAQIGSGKLGLRWSLPYCYDEVLVVASTSSVTATPSGDGSAYTANAAFGSGTDLGSGQYAVYKGSAAKTTLTALTNGTTYYLKLFTRLGTSWSSGVQISQSPRVLPTLFINEIDSDQTGTDTGEFVELYNPQSSSQSLDGLALVLFNGNDDESYAAVDLDGKTIAANGWLVVCAANNTATYCQTGVSFSSLQNGVDAVALYAANATDFPNGTLATDLNKIDALVYENGNQDDLDLQKRLGVSAQYDENGSSNSSLHSLQRNPDGGTTIQAALPTAGAANSTALPVELTAFTAHFDGRTVVLHWQTASEQLNKGFEITRRTNNSDWETMDFIVGMGNAAAPTDYHWRDANLAQSTTYYYQLRQIDLDGTISWSPVVAVDVEATTSVAIYPSPATSVVHVEWGKTPTRATVSLYAADGRKVRDWAANAARMELPVADLPEGVYWLAVTTAEAHVVQPLVKQ